MQVLARSLALATLALLAVLVAAPARAEAPSTMSVQGVLTDGSGNLVPDGAHDLTFSIYLVSVGGVALWTETQGDVPVSRGGFSVILGSVNPLVGPTFGAFRFDEPYYLGTSVDGGPELAPRLPLAAAPYALSFRLPFFARDTTSFPLLTLANHGTGPDIKASGFLAVGAGGIPDPYLGVFPEPGGYALATLGGGTSGGALALYEENVPGPAPGDRVFQVAAYNSGEGGYLVLYGGEDGPGSPQFKVDGNPGTGSPTLTLQGTGSTTTITSGTAGNASVVLPNNAIASSEILDEPGIAQNHGTGFVNIATTMTDVIAVTLTTPAPGYVVVEADAQHTIGGDGTAANTTSFQIDETAGGGVDLNHYFWSGESPASPSLQYRHIATRRTYFKSAAGTYTFRLEGIATNPGAETNYVWQPTITASYFPVSYGTVITSPAMAQAGDFEHVTRTVAAAPPQPAGDGATVDLRELELRVMRERERLAEAERALERARLAATPAAARILLREDQQP